MHPQRIAGVVLVVVGVILLIIGINASNSLADQLSHSFAGRFTQATTWYIVGGIASALLGLLLMSIGLRGKLT